MKPLIKILFLLLFAITINSCEKQKDPCQKEGDVYYEIPLTYRTPLQSYSGYDTLKFKSETGEIFTFYGRGLDTGYSVNSVHHDVCDLVTHYHRKYYMYYFDSSNYKTDLEFVVTVPLNSDAGADLVINVNNISFITDAHLPPLSYPHYINNLLIGNITYNNVLKIFQDGFNTTKGYLYYSFNEGIIQIYFPDGTTLSKFK